MKFKLKYLGILGIAIFVWLLLKINLSQLISVFEKINLIFLGIAFLFSMIALLVNFLRWHYIVNFLGINLSIKKAMEFSFQSLFAEQTPGKIGEPILKSVYLKNYTNSSLPNSLFSTVFHKFIDIWSAVMQSIVVIIFLFFIFKIKLIILIPSVIFFSLIILSLFILIYNKRLIVLIVKPFFNFFVSKKYKEKLKENLIEFYDNFKKINKRILIVSLIYDLIATLISAISLYFISLSMGQTIPFIHMIMIVPLLTIAVGLPISVAGIGVRETTFVFYFSLLKISPEIGIAFGLISLLFRILSIIPGLIISLIKR